MITFAVLALLILAGPARAFELTKEIEKKLGDNKVDLSRISEKAAIELVRKRIGKLKLLPDKMIAKIFGIDRNPRNFLRNCEDICKYAIENNLSKVNEEAIKKP